MTTHHESACPECAPHLWATELMRRRSASKGMKHAMVRPNAAQILSAVLCVLGCHARAVAQAGGPFEKKSERRHLPIRS